MNESLQEILRNAFRDVGLGFGGQGWELLQAVWPAGPAPAAAGAAAASPSQAQAGQSTAAAVGEAALRVFTSGLGLAPLVRGILGLFSGGGDTATPPPLVRFALPPALRLEAANRPGGEGFDWIDYSQEGQPRVIGDTAPGGAGTPAPANITIQVNAMDSRSFLDHSAEIAQAVRQAMLNMHALNDVVTDL